MRFLSHLYLSKPSAFRFTETRDTCELSMACKWIPESAQSHDACFRRSLIASNTFFSRLPLTRRASNMLAKVWTQQQRRTGGDNNANITAQFVSTLAWRQLRLVYMSSRVFYTDHRQISREVLSLANFFVLFSDWCFEQLVMKSFHTKGKTIIIYFYSIV